MTTCLVTAAAAAGAGIVWVQGRSTSPLSSDVPDAPVVVPVSVEALRSSVGVGVAVQRTDGLPVNATEAGLVTSVPVAVGDTLDSGDVVVELNDAPVVAMVSSAPLWRALSSGDKGEDVERLQRFLTDVGVYDGQVDGAFNGSTAAAVNAFNDTHDRSSLGRTFSPETVVWVGNEPLQVSAVTAAPGTPVVAGDSLVTGPSQVTAVSVTEPPGGIPAGRDYELVVGEVSTPYTPGTGTVTDPAAVSEIAATVGTTGEGGGQVVSADTERALVVPASAVVVDPADGTSCVFEDATGDPVVVEVVGGGLSSAQLAPDVNVSAVLVNPLQTRRDPSCT